MNLQEQINDLKEEIKVKIEKYGKYKFAQDFGINKSDVSRFFNTDKEYHRDWSIKKLIKVNEFFQNKRIR